MSRGSHEEECLVTGSHGFIGKNLCLALRRHGDAEVLEFDVGERAVRALAELVAEADVVFHLAGVNRPEDRGGVRRPATRISRATLCRGCWSDGPACSRWSLSSSIQANVDNPYGQSKKAAEEAVLEYHEQTGAPVSIYRFPNVFGKWSRPNYNTVVATFCHNISRGLPVTVNNPDAPMQFVYVDDVVAEFIGAALGERPGAGPIARSVAGALRSRWASLHELILSFRDDPRAGAACRICGRPAGEGPVLDLPVVSRRRTTSPIRWI